jgi:adenylate cyclase class IV
MLPDPLDREAQPARKGTMQEPTGHRRNLEIKVRCASDDLDAIRHRLDALVCAPIQRLHQVDTYFRVDRGRLKVREIRAVGNPDAVDRAELIAYARPSADGSRWSTYQVIPVAAHAAADLVSGLLLTHDLLVRVDKVRHVGLVGQTRVHLDDVEGIGAFVELETVVSSQGEEAASLEHRQVIAALGLGLFDSVPGSYSDLILAEASGG